MVKCGYVGREVALSKGMAFTLIRKQSFSLLLYYTMVHYNVFLGGYLKAGMVMCPGNPGD